MDPVKGVPKPHFVNGWFREAFLGKVEATWSWGRSWQERGEDGAERRDLMKPSGPPCLSGRWSELGTSPEELGTSSLRTSGALTKSLGFMLEGWEPLEDSQLTTVAITADSFSTPYCAIWTA